jgi:hypothetical protein
LAGESFNCYQNLFFISVLHILYCYHGAC